MYEYYHYYYKIEDIMTLDITKDMSKKEGHFFKWNALSFVTKYFNVIILILQWTSGKFSVHHYF